MDDAILFTADVMELYLSILHELGKMRVYTDLTSDLAKMGKLVLQNNYFEFNRETEQKISGTAVGTKFAPLHECIFLDQEDLNLEGSNSPTVSVV